MIIMILGLDLSYSGTGVIGIEGENIILKELISSKHKPGDKDIVRVREIAFKIFKFIDDYKPQLVMLEGPAFLAHDTRFLHNMGKLSGMIENYCVEKGIRFEVAQPTQVKLFCTGKGNCGKDLILLKVFKEYGIEFDNNNLSDAFVLAKIGQALLDKTYIKHPHQEKVVTKILQAEANE